MNVSKREKTAWLLVLAVALLSRFAGLGHRAMSHDESLHAVYSRYLVESMGYHHDPMMHGPLLFHLNGFVDLFLPHTDFTYRLIPALFGVGCVAFLFAYRRWLGARASWIAAAILALDPGHLYYSRYLRNDIYISFFTLWMVWAILRYREARLPKHLLHLAAALGLSSACKEVCYIHGTVFGSACLFFVLLDSIRTPGSFFNTLYRHPLTSCATLLLTLALPFASALLAPELEWDQRSPPSQEIFQTILGLTLIPFGIGTAGAILFFNPLGRLKTWISAFAIFWTIQLTLYTTLFRFPQQGFATGIWGGLGYWLAQHEVERGNPHASFYLSLLLLYSPILLVGLGYALLKWKQPLLQFLLYWAIGNAVIYSWAGERMPWLVIHISLPLILLTATWIDHLFSLKGRKKKWALGLACLGLLQLGLNSIRLSGPHSEGPIEPMMYANSGARVKPAMDIIRDHLEHYPETILVTENQFAWPLLWYVRELPHQYHENIESLPENVSAVITSPDNRLRFLKAGWQPRLEVAMTTWPRPHYHELSLKNFKNLFIRPSVRKKFIGYYLNRSQPEWGPYTYPGPHRFLLVTRNPTEALLPPPLPKEEVLEPAPHP